MEENRWKRDETPYIVFQCRNCGNFMYVKESQKTKKCLRDGCGRNHKVLNIKNSGETVSGMTNALETVKKRQEELAIREGEASPEFRASNDFKKSSKSRNRKNESDKEENSYSNKFKLMLIELSELYSTFPFYVIEIWAEKYRIPNEELKILIRNLQRQGILIQMNNHSYKFKI